MTGSEDLSETRNLVEEINMRTKQLPLTKQDSYANAIYNSATRAQQARKGIKKQGSYEAAVESGAKNQAAAKRTKQILQIRKQDSYTKAIGGSFEDDHSQTNENREPVNKMRKQVGYFLECIFLANVFEINNFKLLFFDSFSLPNHVNGKTIFAFKIFSFQCISYLPTLSLEVTYLPICICIYVCVYSVQYGILR